MEVNPYESPQCDCPNYIKSGKHGAALLIFFAGVIGIALGALGATARYFIDNTTVIEALLDVGRGLAIGILVGMGWSLFRYVGRRHTMPHDRESLASPTSSASGETARTATSTSTAKELP